MVAVLALAGCGDGDDDPPVPDPDAAAYAAAIAPFLPVGDPDDPPTVFVAPLNEPLSLEEQVAVIETLGDGYDLTFVDDPAAAVETDVDRKPVLDDGLLMIVGRFPAEPPFVVRTESYRREGDHTASLVTVRWRGDHWQVTSEDGVDPEAVM
jgi:hypothetical protein